MWFAVTQQNALAAPSLQGLGVSQPLTAELVLEWGKCGGDFPVPLCLLLTFILTTWTPPAFLGKGLGSGTRRN